MSPQADLRTRVLGERGAISALIRRALDEEVGDLVKAGLEPRVAALEETQGQVKAQIEVHAQVEGGEEES